MLEVLPEKTFQNEHYRNAVATFLEVAMATAGRFSSIGAQETTFGHINWVDGVIKFQVVKNRDWHEALLTERAMVFLKARRQFLQATGVWHGEATPLMIGPRGQVVSYQTVNEALKKLAELAALKKKVTTHVPRKSVGTHMAKQNPRLAREQLGITAKVFERNYNQPTLEDRIERRDLLIGATQSSKGTLERLGALTLQLRRGQISQQEYDREANRLELAEATLPRPKSLDPSYG